MTVPRNLSFAQRKSLLHLLCAGSLPAILVHSVYVPWRIATVHKDDARM